MNLIEVDSEQKWFVSGSSSILPVIEALHAAIFGVIKFFWRDMAARL